MWIRTSRRLLQACEKSAPHTIMWKCTRRGENDYSCRHYRPVKLTKAAVASKNRSPRSPGVTGQDADRHIWQACQTWDNQSSYTGSSFRELRVGNSLQPITQRSSLCCGLNSAGNYYEFIRTIYISLWRPPKHLKLQYAQQDAKKRLFLYP
jgi:hypothetical protein